MMENILPKLMFFTVLKLLFHPFLAISCKIHLNLSKVVHIYDVERGWSGANEHYTKQNSKGNNKVKSEFQRIHRKLLGY
jgi:hypothetical protein